MQAWKSTFDSNTTPQEAYNSLLAADMVLMLYGGSSDLPTELGIAIALGKAIYVAKETSGCDPNPFLDVDGVRRFDSVVEALEALLADERGDEDEQREKGVYELRELGGLGTEAGGDSGSDP